MTKLYSVTLAVTKVHVVDLEADSPEQVAELAHGILCQIEELDPDLVDVIEVTEVQENT